MSMLKVLVLVGLLMVAGLVWMIFGPILGRDDTYVIAEDAFLKIAKKLEMDVSDFEVPKKTEISDESRQIVLQWQSKSRPGCRIEVDVDRRCANARPTWNCN